MAALWVWYPREGNFMMPRLQWATEPNPGLSPLLFGASRGADVQESADACH